MLKDLATRLAATLGYAVLPKWRLAQLPMAERLRKIFAAHSIDTVIDVGANKGQYRDFLRHHVGYRGSIVSFEPLPEFAASLKARAAADGNWTVHACALGAAAGELSLNVMAASVFSSFLQPISGGTYAAENTVSRVEVVPVEYAGYRVPEPGGTSHHISQAGYAGLRSRSSARRPRSRRHHSRIAERGIVQAGVPEHA